MRSNMSAGGSAAKVVVTDEMLEVIDIVRPKLVADGMSSSDSTSSATS